MLSLKLQNEQGAQSVHVLEPVDEGQNKKQVVTLNQDGAKTESVGQEWYAEAARQTRKRSCGSVLSAPAGVYDGLGPVFA